jgi:hypothetical protein
MERDRPPEELIEMQVISENERIFLTAHVREDWAPNIISGIMSHPYVERVDLVPHGPQLGFRVTTDDPENWERYTDPFCRGVIGFAIESQST